MSETYQKGSTLPHFFKTNDRNRILLNIGGIANLTYIPAGADSESVIAFDTGPGNMLIDELTKELLNMPFDEGGSIAKNGKIDEDILAKLLKNEYFTRIPPKSTGRELFSGKYLGELKKKVARGAIFADDAIATATEATASSIAAAMNFLPIVNSYPTEIIASGGGVKNIFLCERLHELMPEIPFRISDEVGIPPQAKEALAAMLKIKTFVFSPIQENTYLLYNEFNDCAIIDPGCVLMIFSL